MKRAETIRNIRRIKKDAESVCIELMGAHILFEKLYKKQSCIETDLQTLINKLGKGPEEDDGHEAI